VGVRSGTYVALPGATSCSAHTATLGWTGKAGQVKSASVLVNGSKQASVTNPKAGSSLVLKSRRPRQTSRSRRGW
jgi:hypothetical protein